MGAAEAMPAAAVGFAAIAGLTWVFSSRPRLLMPLAERFCAGRHILRRAEFRWGMRLMAGLRVQHG